MSITINSESKVQGPTWIRSLMFLRTLHFVPSKARTTIWLFLMSASSIGNLDKVDISITLSDEPLSRRARGIIWFLYLIVMWRALVLSKPFGGISSSVKVMQALAVIFPTNWSILSIEIVGVTYASPRPLKGRYDEFLNFEIKITKKSLRAFCSTVFIVFNEL